MDSGNTDLSHHTHILLPDTKHVDSDSFLDEFWKNSMSTSTTCTHTHTCDPPGPDNPAHSHTCLHAHTQVLSPEQDDQCNNGSSPRVPKKTPMGNREAVRKYREKKKAHTAYLEEEVKNLKALNQELLRRLQSQVALEAEILRLRGLLTELRGKIDMEMDSFVLKGGHFHGNLMPCEAGFGGERRMLTFSWEASSCQEPIVDCRADNTGGIDGADRQTMETTVESLVSSASQPG